MRIQVSHGASGDWFIVRPTPAEDDSLNQAQVDSLLRAHRTVYELDVEERLAAEVERRFPIVDAAAAEAAKARAEEHLRYYDWVDDYASRVVASFGVPLPLYDTRRTAYPYPGDYAIDWPREIRLDMNDREWIFKVWFADRLVCVVKPAPYHTPHHRLRRLLIAAAERAMHYPEAWAT